MHGNNTNISTYACNLFTYRYNSLNYSVYMHLKIYISSYSLRISDDTISMHYSLMCYQNITDTPELTTKC